MTEDAIGEMATYCYERMGLAEGARSYDSLYDTLIAWLTRSY
jgi:hypothetical protein